MRFYWRGQEVNSHDEWRRRVALKDDKPGRSAPTLAAAWSGPAELFGAIRAQPALAALQVEEVRIEEQARFDHHSGPRNHDLLITAQAAEPHSLFSTRG